MIPISDSPRSQTRPYVTYLLILANFGVFFYELGLSQLDLARFFFDWGVVPSILSDYLENPDVSRWDEAARPVTAQFIHAGWLHLLGNMLFLYVFGDNVEDALGHRRYLVFYLGAGYVGALAQVYTNTSDAVPMVGASGAIAGVLGAYLLLYPRARVVVVVPFLFFAPLVVPALTLIVIWFVTQLFSGLASVGYATGGEGGTAWWAHVGGFASGALAGPLLARRG